MDKPVHLQQHEETMVDQHELSKVLHLRLAAIPVVQTDPFEAQPNNPTFMSSPLYLSQFQ